MYTSGVRGRPNLPDRDRHCAKTGRGDFPRPAPSRADATHTGWRPRALTQRRVSRIHSQTERRHLHCSAGLSISAPALAPEITPDSPKARRCNVCARLTLRKPSPLPRAAASVLAHSTVRHHRPPQPPGGCSGNLRPCPGHLGSRGPTCSFKPLKGERR